MKQWEVGYVVNYAGKYAWICLYAKPLYNQFAPWKRYSKGKVLAREVDKTLRDFKELRPDLFDINDYEWYLV